MGIILRISGTDLRMPRANGKITTSAVIENNDRLVIADMTFYVVEKIHHMESPDRKIAPNTVVTIVPADVAHSGVDLTQEQMDALREWGFE